MYLDPAMPLIVVVVFALTATSILARAARQPQIIGYLFVGLLLGPSVFGFIEDPDLLSRFGAIGVVLLLFFVGLEVSPRSLARAWRVALFCTTAQISVSVLIVLGVGFLLDWPIARAILIGFVIALSSTAVVIRLLEEWQEVNTPVGQDTFAVLLAQDVAVVPMLLVVGLLAGTEFDLEVLVLQILAGVALVALAAWASIKPNLKLPFARVIAADHELQVLFALLVCLGLALFSGMFHLTAALGAFVAGIVVRATPDADWVIESLRGFRVIFVALFFVSIGSLVDLKFLWTHWLEVAFLVGVVIFVNTSVNASIIRLLGRPWKHSLYAGAMLSQIGEFSFVLAAVGFNAGLISLFGYQMTVSIIALTIVLSPAWIVIMRRILRIPTTGPSKASIP